MSVTPGAAPDKPAAVPAAGPWAEPAAGKFRIHRPERSWPHPPEPVPLELVAPPSKPDEATGKWTSMLPLLGSLAMVGFAFLIRNLIYLVVVGAMVLAMVGAGVAASLSQRRRRAKSWARINHRYAAHLQAVRAAAAAAATAQRDAAEACFPDPAVLGIVAAGGEGLWERRPGDADFGAVRLGRGVVPASCPARLARDEPLADADPDLAAAADRVLAETATLAGAPVTIPLGQLSSIAVVGEPRATRALAGAWLASLATFHAPAEMRIMGLVPLSAVRAWDWLKWLPHTRDPEGGEGLGRTRRAVTADEAAFTDQVEALAVRRMERLRRRNEQAGLLAAGAGQAGGADGRSAGRHGGPGGGGPGTEAEHIVILVDGYRPGHGRPGLEALLASGALVGVTVVVLVASHTEVPAACGAILDWDADGTVRYVESGPQGRVEAGVVPDYLDTAAAAQLARTLAPLSLRAGQAGADLADPVRLVELLGADEAAQLDLAAEWRAAGSLSSGLPADFLAMPIGRRDDGSPLILDLKEAAAGGMGPHGMLVGATGSGKSELLRSFAAALAARHDPALVNLLLIDFKGGAAFAELAALPHVAGLVTNLADDLSLVDRVQLALSGELARRQEALRLAGNLGSIADYQAARARGEPLPPLPYLVIVVDEFGELLVAKPEFLDTFLTVTRLGRSLGVHLLLATQRLDEGRIRGLEPHLRYRLCLRTFTAEESRAVLGTADAYELPSLPGLGYLKVDTHKSRFKAALCASARPWQESDAQPDADVYQAPAPTTAPGTLLRPLSLVGAADGGPAVTARNDLQVLVQTAADTARSRARMIWVPPLPASLTLGALETQAAGAAGPGVALALADYPERQDMEAVRYDHRGAGGNAGVAGAPRSGKSTLLQTLVLALAKGISPAERQFYCLDLGGGSLFELASLPHVGAVIGRGETEAAERLFRELRALLDERAGQRQSGSATASWPDVFLIVDNVGQLRQSAPDLEPDLIELATAGLPFRLHVVLSANRWFDIRPQLLDALGSRWELHLADPAESLAGRQAASRVPSGQPGRGLTRDGHLFQAALPALSAEPAPGSLSEAVAALTAATGPLRAPAIGPLPLRVTEADVPGLAHASGSARPDPGSGFLLGISEFRSRPVQIDLTRPGERLLVYGDAGSGRSTLLRRIVHHLQAVCTDENMVLDIVDPGRGLLDLADGPGIEGYAASATAAQSLALRLSGQLRPRVAPEGASVAELRGRWWSGPRHMLVVDDYDLLIGPMGGPFADLADLIAQGADIGLGIVLARRVAGSQRTAFEAFGQRLREVADHVLILSGQPDEGPLTGGVGARPRPPGRGVLVAGRSRPQLVQCCLGSPEALVGSARGAS
jgi:DNA segregation ATPase FtsK/SpoIIIE, S-DNA-T family